jgi:hypothetical protein
VWFYPDGNKGFRYGFNPLVVDGVMYVVGKDNATVALDAVTGKEIWVHDNGTPRTITNRGSITGKAKTAATAASSTPPTICCMRSTRAPASWWIRLATMAVSISRRPGPRSEDDAVHSVGRPGTGL